MISRSDSAAKQLSFDTDPRTLARSTDPESSHEAARRVVRNGNRAAQAADVHQALQRYGKRTSHGLASIAGLDRYMVARRLPELEREGCVRRTEMIMCPVAGRMAQGWVCV